MLRAVYKVGGATVPKGQRERERDLMVHQKWNNSTGASQTKFLKSIHLLYETCLFKGTTLQGFYSLYLPSYCTSQPCFFASFQKQMLCCLCCTDFPIQTGLCDITGGFHYRSLLLFHREGDFSINNSLSFYFGPQLRSSDWDLSTCALCFLRLDDEAFLSP